MTKDVRHKIFVRHQVLGTHPAWVSLAQGIPYRYRRLSDGLLRRKAYTSCEGAARPLPAARKGGGIFIRFATPSQTRSSLWSPSCVRRAAGVGAAP